MRRQRCTSVSMICMYFLAPALVGWELGHPQVERLAAGEDGRERVVDLVHHPGGELPSAAILRLGQALLRLAHAVTSRRS